MKHPLLLFSLAVLLSVASSQSAAMDKTGWRTHCFGRFLIDLPPQAGAGGRYYLWRHEIERLNETAQSLENRLKYRELQDKAQHHVSFIRRLDHDGGSTTLLFWDHPFPQTMDFQRLDTYLVVQDPWQGYDYTQRRVEVDKQDIALELAETLARTIHARADNAIPTGPGFCIRGASITGDGYRPEAAQIAITMPEYPDLKLSFRSQTGREENTLLERINSFFKGLGEVAIDTPLRLGQHNVGPITAQEYLIARSGKGQRLYSFIWEAQGMEASLAYPILSVELGMSERFDPNRKPWPPTFTSEQQALDLWDSVINSIRLRPGAVGETP